MSLIATISAIAGVVSGIVPDVIKSFNDSAEHKREMEMRKFAADTEVRMLELKQKIEVDKDNAEAYAAELNAYADHVKAAYDQMKPTGVSWVDAWSALIRPAVSSLIFTIFGITAIIFVYATTSQYMEGSIDINKYTIVLWNSLLGEMITGLFLFWFPNRAVRKMAANR